MRCLVVRLPVSQQPHRIHSGTLCRIELALDIRKKKNLVRSKLQFVDDAPVGTGVNLGPDSSIKVAIEKVIDIAIIGMPKQQLLCIHGSR